VKKYLCGFADKRIKYAPKRFARQAKQMRVYDDIFLYTEDDLDKEFYAKFEDKFCLRGFGYWVWKPQVILQTLSKMEEGDIVQYSDIGCHFNKRGRSRLLEYFETTKNERTGILCFTAIDCTEKQHTKGDLFDYFNIRNNESIFPEQIVATTIFTRKCEKSMEIIRNWLQVFYDDFHLVDDSPSRNANFDEFIENRHDQSVLSILAKINNVAKLDYAEQVRLFSDDPIWAIRDRYKFPLPISKIVHLLGLPLKKILPMSMFIKLKQSIWAFLLQFKV